MTKKNVIFIFTAILSSFFCGLITLVATYTFSDKYIYLAAFPIAFLILCLFIFNRYLFLAAVIITRASLDVFFDAIKFGNFGLGAVLNALVILIAFLILIEKREEIVAAHNVYKSWVVFILVSFISLFYAPTFLPSLKVFLVLVSYASMFYLGHSLVKKESDFSFWLKAIIYSSAIPIAYGFYSMIFGGGGMRLSIGEGYRVQSTFNHPNSYAFYLALLVTISFYIFKAKPIGIGQPLVKLMPAYILLLLISLIMTKTRSAWVACYIFFLAYGVLFERKFLIKLFVLSLLILLIPDVQDRFMDLQRGNDFGASGYGKLNSWAWRKKYWHDAIFWMEEIRYIFGYGLRSFMHYSTTFGMGNAFNKQSVELNAHNVYVQIFFELGIIGLISFIMLLINHLRYIYEYYSVDKLLASVVMVMMVEYIFENGSDNILDYLNFDWYLWFTVGLSLSYLNFKAKTSGNNLAKKNLV